MINIKDFLSKKNATAIAAAWFITEKADLSLEKTICLSVIILTAILVQGFIDYRKGKECEG